MEDRGNNAGTVLSGDGTEILTTTKEVSVQKVQQMLPKTRVIELLRKNHGDQLRTCDELSCTFSQLQTAIEKDKEIENALDMARMELVAKAEGAIYRLMDSLDPNIALKAATFVLKRLGKDNWSEAQVQQTIISDAEKKTMIMNIFNLKEEED